MKSLKKSQKVFFIVLILIIILTAFIWFRYNKIIISKYEEIKQSYLQQSIEDETYSWENKNKNKNTNLNMSVETSTGSLLKNKISDKKPETYNLKMEFHSQAPLLKWDHLHQEMCEEASILLVINYFKDISMTNEEFDKELVDMQKKEVEILGIWESTTVKEMKEFIEKYFQGFRVEIIENITEEQIEEYVASNIPVLLPVSGRTIKNPFYTPPGPVYHILVIKGYTKTHFITNDVGTKRGKDFFYEKQILMDNIYDWNEYDIFSGEKRGFVILPR